MDYQKITLNSPLDRKTYHTVPDTCGVYIFKQNNTFLYIGKSVQLRARILSHLENAKQNEKEYAIMSNSTELNYVVTDSEFKSLLLESRLIQKYHPKYNVIWRDDKSYLYIKITKEEYPKILTVRKENDGASSYFGPFSSFRQTAQLLRIIRKIIPFCTQKRSLKHACFYYKIGMCNPCPGIIQKMPSGLEKDKQKALYRKQIQSIKRLFDGTSSPLFTYFNSQLNKCIKQEAFEEGIVIRNKIQRLQELLFQRSFDTEAVHSYNNSEKDLYELHLILLPFFQKIPNLKRIECYDISNINQQYVTGSMVVFTDGLMNKSQYRRFKIKNPTSQSDFEALQEVITRRFSHHTWKYPDLIVIDGGVPQIREVLKSLKRMKLAIPCIGIAKKPDRIIIGLPHFPTVRPSIHNAGFSLIQRLRDESHRFAKKYHLYLRDTTLI